MTRNLLGFLFLVCTLSFAGKSLAQSVAAQAATDDKILTEYFAKNNIKATKTASGMYYVIHKEGTGEKAKVGQQTTMLYYGYFLDGKRFDGNMDRNYTPSGNPFTFSLGTHQVIPGWDEGVQLLNKGARATFYLPSGLAYGARSVGPIPANSVLAFDVELVSMQ